MIRTQIQLDETTYALVKQRAFAENKSLAAVCEGCADAVSHAFARPFRGDG